MQILYQIEVTKTDIQEALENYKNYLNIKEEQSLSFAEELLKGIISNQEFLDGMIKKYCKKWSLERLNINDKNILRMALYEFFFRPDIPPIVSINEAIELAKIYGTDESQAFINGILDSVYKNELLPKRESSVK